MGSAQALAFFFIWLYWKGQDWSRILVLLWSFVVAAKELSILIDRDGSLTSLMIQPIRFFQALLAVFLLYWLNIRPVRAWFKKMSATTADLIHQQLGGKLCTAVERDHSNSGDGWRFEFEHEAELVLNCPFRIVLDDNLAFASNPGAGVSIDEQVPQQLLQNLRVKAVRVTSRTSDLFITFEMGIEVQTWSGDSKLRQWKFSDPTLIVTADSMGLNSQAIAAPISTEDSAAND